MYSGKLKTATYQFFILLAVLTISGGLQAREYVIQPEHNNAQSVIDKAADGDTVHFTSGIHKENLNVHKSLIITGESGTILDGGNQGDVLRVHAPNVTVRDLHIRYSGHNLTKMNAGIFVEKSAENILVENNTFYANGFGIWLNKAVKPRILNNKIHAKPEVRSQDRGNGIHLSGTTHGIIKANEVWDTRDGIYIENSQHNILEKNILHDLRYGIHYMYSYSNRVIENHTYNTRTGYALMQSKYLTVLNNTSSHDRNYGMLLNFITHSTLANNRIQKVKEGAGYVTGGSAILGAEGKAVFIYNSQFNKIHDNLFAHSDIGIHLTAGSEDNQVYGNAFINNRVQVKYVATRQQDWSHEGRGNYWSDYLGWDLDADGIGDKQYEPNDAVDKLLWKYPMSRILMSSPAIETLRWVQEQFPVLRPQGVRDSAPMMQSPFTLQTKETSS